MRLLAEVALLAGICAAAEPGALFDARDWFALREAVSKGPAPPLLRGAAAAAFHDAATAERELRLAIRRGPRGRSDVVEAHRLLVALYMRQGQFRKAAPHNRAVLDSEEVSEDRKKRDLVEVAAKWPDQRLLRMHPGRIPLPFAHVGVVVPASVNGHAVQWIFDTGCNLSAISESEARRFGLEVRDTSSPLHDSTGKTTPMRIGYARDLQVGGAHLRNVVFFVLPDDRNPFVSLKPGQQGIIGMPVMLALGTVSWGSDGYMKIGGPALGGEPNLAFDAIMPVLQIRHAGRAVPVIFDTGAEKTSLWPRFASEFPETMKSGVKGTTQFSGLGNTVEIDSVTLPRLAVEVGGRDLSISNARALLQQEGDGAKYYYANLGSDWLMRANRVTIDFRSMRLKLE